MGSRLGTERRFGRLNRCKLHERVGVSAGPWGRTKQDKAMAIPKSVLTHTFSESVENHAGMQMIGAKREKGFDEDALAAIATKLADMATLHELAHETTS